MRVFTHGTIIFASIENQARVGFLEKETFEHRRYTFGHDLWRFANDGDYLIL